MNDILRILLLQDSASDRELVEDALTSSGIAATLLQVDSQEAFRQALPEFRPHVVLTDGALAPIDAHTALDVVREVRPLAPVIVLADTLDGLEAVRALRRGAEDLVLRSNLRRIGESIARALEIRRPLEQLSPRQMEVLCLVVDGATTREIAERLRLSVKTIETHRGEVMKRLGIHDLVSLVRYATRVGLVTQTT